MSTKAGIIKLFTPALTPFGKQTGYVNAYPQGVRENGGQYTHAAVWLCLAMFRNNQPDEGYRLLRLINPAAKLEDREKALRYKTEPYAFAGDVYSAKGMEGRGGWSLYTGAVFIPHRLRGAFGNYKGTAKSPFRRSS